jgi:hypothetical protein
MASTNPVALETYVGAFLPHRISDTFVDDAAMCEWAIANGYDPIASRPNGDAPRITVRFPHGARVQLHVYRNGWVCEPDAASVVQF